MSLEGAVLYEYMKKAAEIALEGAAQDVLEAAKNDAPRETDELRDSGKVEIVHHGNIVEAVISFDVPYAAAQEIGGFHDRGGQFVEIKEHPGGGKSHFLGDNVKSLPRRYRRYFQAAVQEVFR